MRKTLNPTLPHRAWLAPVCGSFGFKKVEKWYISVYHSIIGSCPSQWFNILFLMTASEQTSDRWRAIIRRGSWISILTAMSEDYFSRDINNLPPFYKETFLLECLLPCNCCNLGRLKFQLQDIYFTFEAFWTTLFCLEKIELNKIQWNKSQIQYLVTFNITHWKFKMNWPQHKK